MKLSAVLNTKNAAATLAAALKSVSFCDEIIVVDMHSTDETRSIAKEYTNQVFKYQDDVGYADPARNFALAKAKGEWILVLDADEVIGEELKKYILAIVKQQPALTSWAIPGPAECYYVTRKNVIFQKWMQHSGWWPDYQPRLFKNGSVSWQVGVHRLPDVQGLSIQFPAVEQLAIWHHNYPTVKEYIERLNRYTGIQADERLSSSSSPLSHQPLTAQRVFATFSQEFMQRFFGFAGYKDGAHGAALALLQATYELVVTLKQAENTQTLVPAETESVPAGADQLALAAARQFQRDLAYWLADYQVSQTRGLVKWWWQIRRKLKV